jgi:hypothetical protein
MAPQAGTLAAIGAMALAFSVLAPATAVAQNPRPATIFAPSNFETFAHDELIRFSWMTYNSQDFFRIIFNRFRYSGWETTPYQTRETVLSSINASADEVGLSSDTWYWRLCYGWNDDPARTCYLDDTIRQFDVEVPPPPAPFLSYARARSVTRSVIRRRYRVRPRVFRCARVNRSEILCGAVFRRRGRRYARIVEVEARADGLYFSIRKP